VKILGSIRFRRLFFTTMFVAGVFSTIENGVSFAKDPEVLKVKGKAVYIMLNGTSAKKGQSFIVLGDGDEEVGKVKITKVVKQKVKAGATLVSGEAMKGDVLVSNSKGSRKKSSRGRLNSSSDYGMNVRVNPIGFAFGAANIGLDFKLGSGAIAPELWIWSTFGYGGVGFGGRYTHFHSGKALSTSIVYGANAYYVGLTGISVITFGGFGGYAYYFPSGNSEGPFNIMGDIGLAYTSVSASFLGSSATIGGVGVFFEVHLGYAF